MATDFVVQIKCTASSVAFSLRNDGRFTPVRVAYRTKYAYSNAHGGSASPHACLGCKSFTVAGATFADTADDAKAAKENGYSVGATTGRPYRNGVRLSYPFLFFKVPVMRGSMISGSTEYEFCMGDHRSPAFFHRDFRFAALPFYKRRDGRPLVAPTVGGGYRMGDWWLLKKTARKPVKTAARKSMLKIVDKSGVVWYPSDTNRREPHRRRAAGREIRADSARRKGRKQT